MARKRMLYIILAVCMFFLLTACGKRTDVKDGESFIYTLNGERTGLTKISYTVTQKDPEKAAKAMLKELAEKAEDIDYTTALPENVKVQKCELRSEVLYIDFNTAYLKMTPVEEKLVRAAIVDSLCKIDGVNILWFTVDGENLKDSTGQILGYQNEDDFVQNTGSSLSSYETTTLKLFFADDSGGKLVKQSMEVKYSSNTSREKLIVEKLMKGPKKGSCKPTINPAASLLGVTIKDGICYVNFDDEFLNSVYDVKPEIVIYSVVNSLVEGTSASKVQITINGEKNVSYMEKVDLSQPLQRDTSWVEDTEEK